MDPWISLATLGVRDIEYLRRIHQSSLGWLLSPAGTEDIAFFHTGGMALTLHNRELLATDAKVSCEESGFAGMALAHNVAMRELVDTDSAAAVGAGAPCSYQRLTRSGAATPTT
jgi:hypothetical protein